MHASLFTCLLAAVVLLCPAASVAHDSPRSNPLTPILSGSHPTARSPGANLTHRARSSATVPGLSDDFSGDAVGGPAAGWNAVSGIWSVCQSGTVHAYCQASRDTGESLSGAAWWSDYTVDALVTDSNVAYGVAAIIGRVTAPGQYYEFELRSQVNGSLPYWYILRKGNGPVTTLAGGPLNAPDTNPNYCLRLTFSGSTITASIAFDGGTNFRVVATGTDSSYPTGQIGTFTWGTAGVRFTNVNVVLAGTSTLLPSETAISSDAFVDSIGMNAHFESPTYYQNYAQVRSLVGNLGVRHYRVSAANLSQPNYQNQLAMLYSSYGTKFDVLASRLSSPAQVVQALALLPTGSVDSVEGPNENDSQSQGAEYDPNFASDLPSYMSSLYATLKSTPATAQLPIIGPSFANYTSYAAVGNLSKYVDAGNTHDYFAGFNPGTVGWGGNGFSFAPSLYYGSIDWNVAASAQATGSKPVVATETGYFTAAIHGGVPLDVQAKYVPRIFFEQYRHHIPRTFMYQLIGSNTNSADGSLEIVTPSYVPAPAYNALAGLVSLLSEGGRQSAAVIYNWGLTGQTLNVDHLLLHKADGTFVLPLWIESASFDPNANGGMGARIVVPRQTVTVTISQPASSGVLWTCDPTSGAWSPAPVTIINGMVTLDIGDSVSVLEIGPSAQLHFAKRRVLR